MSESYSLATDELDRERLNILNECYNPGSVALLKRAGVAQGARFLEVGCGHGGMLPEIASLIGPKGELIAVDSSAEQLKKATHNIKHYPVKFMQRSVDDLTDLPPVDFVYCRLLLMHLSDPIKAIEQMLSCLSNKGKLLMEIGDVRTHRYIPSDPITNQWQQYWFALGESLGATYLFCDQAYSTFQSIGLTIHDFNVNMPVSADKKAKSLHYIGFKQLSPVYIENHWADQESIDKQLAAYETCIDSKKVYVELYKMLQFVLTK